MRRVFPVVVLSFVVAVGLVAMVLQPSSLPALAASSSDEAPASIPLAASVESRPVLLGAGYRADDDPAPVGDPSAVDPNAVDPSAPAVAPSGSPAAETAAAIGAELPYPRTREKS